MYRQQTPHQPAVIETLEHRKLLTATIVNGGVTVEHFYDNTGGDVPPTGSVVTVKFDKNIRIGDKSKMQMRANLVDPATGQTRRTRVHIWKIRRDEADITRMFLWTNKQVPQGATLFLTEGAISDTKARVARTQEGTTANGLSPQQYVLASRQFQPTDRSFFSTTNFTGTTAGTAGVAKTEAQVRTDLRNFMNRKVTAGVLTQAQADGFVARFDDSRVSSIMPNPNLRAALLSLGGTVGEPAIGAMLDGQNLTGKPWTIITFTSETAASAEIAETLRNSVERLRTLVKPAFANEPFTALAGTLAHEALHQDTANSQQEEIVTNVVETMVYAQQVLNDGSVASAGTVLTKRANDRLLAMLNSGKSTFPTIGVLSGPVTNPPKGVFFNGVTPAAGGVFTGFENMVRREYAARNFASGTTTGNATYRAMYANLTGRTSTTANFGNSEIAEIDQRQTVLDTAKVLRLASTLKLTV